jgi:hypothetical protein
MSGKDEYTGPETNETYSDEESFQTFEDLDEEQEDDGSSDSVQGTSSFEENEEGGNADDEEEEELDEEERQEKVARQKRKEKDAAKKAKGQKGDDLDKLDTLDEVEEEDEEEEEEKPKEEEEDEEEEEETEDKPEDKKPKGKPTYVDIDGETFALTSNALITLPVDGKNEKVTLQELKNSYNAKVVGDKRFNEINVKEINFKKQEAAFNEKLGQFNGAKQQIEEIIKDVTKNPKDALKIFLDSVGVDSYDLMERQFKADLEELANVLNMEPAERKSYFLERKNSHLLEQSKKRDEQRQTEERVRSYTQKVDALRKSNGVSEAQYVDAREELLSYGTAEKDLNERDIVEWAATKPHRESVKSLLTPYEDQFGSQVAYGELSWKLVSILRAGSESPDDHQKAS